MNKLKRKSLQDFIDSFSKTARVKAPMFIKKPLLYLKLRSLKKELNRRVRRKELAPLIIDHILYQSLINTKDLYHYKKLSKKESPSLYFHLTFIYLENFLRNPSNRRLYNYLFEMLEFFSNNYVVCASLKRYRELFEISYGVSIYKLNREKVGIKKVLPEIGFGYFASFYLKTLELAGKGGFVNEFGAASLFLASSLMLLHRFYSILKNEEALSNLSFYINKSFKMFADCGSKKIGLN